MKWIRLTAIAVAVLVCVVVGAAFLTALRTEHPVGFQIVRATDPDQKPFAVAVWYPTQAHPRPTTMLGVALMDVAPDAPVAGSALPLVVISHGNGGGPASHADLALALANAGYVVAAPMHTGDNYAERSAAGSGALFSNRVRQLHATVDYMLKNWPGHDRINPDRVGAFGFSAGGFTVLTAAGAQPDLRLVSKQCAQSPEFICKVLREANSPLLGTDTSKIQEGFSPDPRIKAAVVAAPGLGFSMPPDRLANVHVPVQLWSADQDASVPYATNTKLVREALGSRAEFHSVPGAGHLSFLTPCGVLGSPAICSDQEGFDRKAFHANMNAIVVAFFDKNMRKP